MKRTILIFFIVIVTLPTSCSQIQDKKFVTITDFSKGYRGELLPKESLIHEYTTYFVEIKGEVNDSIILRFHEGEDAIQFYFIGKINKRLSFDYYGGTRRVFIFDPFKATNGRLKIEYGLY